MKRHRSAAAVASPPLASADDAAPPPESEPSESASSDHVEEPGADHAGESTVDTESAQPAKPAKLPKETPERLSPTMRNIRDEEEQSLHAWLDDIGQQGSFRVQLRRNEPASCRDPRTGRDVITKGYLNTYDHTIDEGFIAREWGGGTYYLRITRPDQSGSSKYAKGLHRTITIAGEPRLDKLPSNAPPPAQEQPQGENPKVIQHALDMMERIMNRESGQSKGIDPAMSMLIEQMREQTSASERANAELRRELADLRGQQQKPREDPFRDAMLRTMMEGESGRVAAVRAQCESEIRQARELHMAEIKRLEDRHDRTVTDMRQSHERAISDMRQSYEREISTVKETFSREISALRSSHEVALAAAKTASEIQSHTLKTDNSRLERDLDSVRKERDALRDRKDKPIIEQLQELNKLKEAMGVGDDSGDSTVGKVFEALPAIGETIGGIIGQARQAAAPAQAAAQQAQVQAQAQAQAPRVVRRPDGQRFIQRGNQLVPVKRKPELVTTDTGNKVEAPPVDQAQLALVINLLEQAFRRSESPEIVAQTGRAAIPADIISWIRDNDTEQTSGVELFLRQVAKLPGSSPLASQAGRNWIRKVGKALVEGA